MATKKLDLVTWLKNWFESKTNKVTSLSSTSTDTEYPTAKAVYDAIQNSGGCVEDYYFDSTTKEIVIDYVCGSGSGGGSGGNVTVDDSWVANSTNPVQSQIIKLALDGKADSNHTHSQYLTEHQSLANYVLTTDSRLSDARTPTTHTHTKSQITDFPTVPTASTAVPSADTASGSYGSGTVYARSNHVHPKSTLYAEASHTHSAYVNPTIADNLTTNDSSQVLSAKQGKVLNDLIGQAITYINQ